MNSFQATSIVGLLYLIFVAIVGVVIQLEDIKNKLGRTKDKPEGNEKGTNND